VKYDERYNEYIRDVAERLDGVSQDIRAETVKKLAERRRRFEKESEALHKAEPDFYNPDTRGKYMNLVEFFLHDTDTAIRKAHEEHLKEASRPRKAPPREPVRATDVQIRRWEKYAMETLSEKHRNATGQFEQRQQLEQEKSTDERLRQHHFNEKAAFDDRKRIDRENLLKQFARVRETRLVPSPEFAPTHTREEIDRWAKEFREELQSTHDEFGEHLPGESEFAPDIEWHHMEYIILEAYETGRIPGEEPQARRQERGLER